MLLSGSDLGELPCGLWMEMVSQLDLSVNNLISTVLLDLGRLPALAVVLNLLRNRLSEDLPPKLGSLPTTASTTSSTRSCSLSRLSAMTHCVPQQCGFSVGSCSRSPVVPLRLLRRHPRSHRLPQPVVPRRGALSR
jgi:hypothetical protein